MSPRRPTCFMTLCCLFAVTEPSLAAGEVVVRLRESEISTTFPGSFRASEAKRNGELHFTVLTNSVWPVPEPDGFSPLALQIRIVNRATKSQPLIPILGMPVLTSPFGKLLKARDQGRTHIRAPKEPVSLAPDQAIIVTERAHLYMQGKQLSLNWEDHMGTTLSYDNLVPGNYVLNLKYKIGNEEILTHGLVVPIRDLATSKPLVSGQFSVCALADKDWPIPEGGKDTVIALGFRITSMRTPRWARVLPSIAAIDVYREGGAKVSVKKSRQLTSRQGPALLAMRPERSYTCVEPGVLAYEGKSLVLSWEDMRGNLYRAEGLKPGNYNVRFVIQGEAGKVWSDQITWTGEITTEWVTVQIR